MKWTLQYEYRPNQYTYLLELDFLLVVGDECQQPTASNSDKNVGHIFDRQELFPRSSNMTWLHTKLSPI